MLRIKIFTVAVYYILASKRGYNITVSNLIQEEEGDKRFFKLYLPKDTIIPF